MAHEQIINIAALVKKKLDSLPSSTSQPCIYKIPPHLFEVKRKAYLPKVVSIGPIHCKKSYLRATQELKSQLLQCFLQETSQLYSLEDYLHILRDNEGRARSCYAETVSLSSDEFILMLLIDAVFLINCMMVDHEEMHKYCTGSNLLKRRKGILNSVAQDMILEENQIPFFILEIIYGMSFGKLHPDKTFINIACTFLSFFIEIDGERVKLESNFEHLVDLMLRCLKPTGKGESKYCQLRSSVTHLRAVGVKFKATKSKNLLDITFEEGVLSIPKFNVCDSTESVYRSILAFEQCHHYYDTLFGEYMSFLAALIKTPEDVHILVRSEIIENWLGSEAAVGHLFNHITDGIPLCSTEYYYSDIVIKLNKHASGRVNRWKAILKRDYFGHPWAIISLIYALILFILTLLQTIGTFTRQ